MSLAEQLSQLRPLMTRAEIKALLGPEDANRALDQFSGFKRTTGVEISFSHRDEVIDSIYFSAIYDFPRDVAVCGVCIGMTVDAMQKALPEVRLADGETGQPNAHGFVQYRAEPASLNATTLGIGVKDGEVAGIGLRRTDMDEVNARREREEAETRAERDRKLERESRWKSIPDPDEMLRSWAAHCSPWDESPDKYVRFAHWLIATPDPDLWHIVAMRCNWDYGLAPLLWIIRQKNCAIATALATFFLASPASHFRYGNDRSSVPGGYQREGFDFLVEIRERLPRGFYSRSEIAFDGERHMSITNRGVKTAEDKALARSFFPPEAGRKIRGRDPVEIDSKAAAECWAILATIN